MTARKGRTIAMDANSKKPLRKYITNKPKKYNLYLFERWNQILEININDEFWFILLFKPSRNINLTYIYLFKLIYKHPKNNNFFYH